jgi:demethylmenaquinone methyltransferase/2-methoxy-6-polyprenyl-1,4-benzoquinol methylase
MAQQTESATHFGSQQVPLADKQLLVDGVFRSVAQRYDLMNDLMSGGLHRAWKAAMITTLNPPKSANPFALLDVAGGTGDIAFRIAKRTRAKGRQADITVCDINLPMLEQGRRRPEADEADIAWICGDAEDLPIEDASQDAYTIAFGIRNTTHLDDVLDEAYRVLKPGGRFLCLEFSRVAVPGLDRLYDLYSFSVLPRLGELVAGDGAAYRYLAESIRRFPSQRAFAKAIGEAGFEQVKYRNLSGGIAAMHSGWKV